jgi:hypothetical protein
MSYAVLYEIKEDGTFEEVAEYKNSHGWTAFVWTQLCEKYGVVRAVEDDGYQDESGFNMGMMTAWGYLWKLVKDKDPRTPLKPWEQNVLIATYDNACLKREHFETFAKSLERFEEAHANGRVVCHLKTMAEHIRNLGESAIGICWYPMSVAENPWFVYDEELGDSVPYDFSTGDKHWFAGQNSLNPECDKMQAVQSKSQVIGEFLEWLNGKYVIAQWVEVEGYKEEQLLPAHTVIEKLLAEYFEIDLEKVEAEKREILEELRTHG